MDTKPSVPPPYDEGTHQYQHQSQQYPGNAPQNYQQPQPNYGYPPQQQTPQPIIMMQPPSQTSTSVTVNTGGGIGVGCPVCHNNSWTGSYSCCAWCLAILCFPIGIICCCCMRRKKCTKCGYTVG
ncbi:uncharacterized protein [Diabrotica undecimpunctata]|uniref:uncharacterized protein n=1 Tax=Diabrotica undecimpunctata TaxID=50387 RepID=UPI003B6367B0